MRGFAAFVFVYRCRQPAPDALFQEVFENQGQWYALHWCVWGVRPGRCGPTGPPVGNWSACRRASLKASAGLRARFRACRVPRAQRFGPRTLLLPEGQPGPELCGAAGGWYSTDRNRSATLIAGPDRPHRPPPPAPTTTLPPPPRPRPALPDCLCTAPLRAARSGADHQPGPTAPTPPIPKGDQEQLMGEPRRLHDPLQVVLLTVAISDT